MGMDVYGKAPTSEAGEYFRNNIWWWGPLARYCIAVAPEICERCESWFTNDGAGLNKQDSLRLAGKLKEEIQHGRTHEIERELREAEAKAPRQPCRWCNATGIRDDEVGRQYGWPEKIVDGPPDNPRLGLVGSCNACEGWGSTKPETTPFDVENVAEFAKFLEHCGGFRIC